MKGFFYCACLCTPSITSRICGTIFSLAGVRMFLCLTYIPATLFLGSLAFPLSSSSSRESGKTRDLGNEVETRVHLSSYQQLVEIITFSCWVQFLISYSVNHYFKLVWCSCLTGFSGVLTFCVYLPYMQFKISRFSAGSVTVNLFLYVAL